MQKDVNAGSGATGNDKPLPNVYFAASSAADQFVHVVRARAVAVADPTAQTTSCGQPVAELYRQPRAITCAGCSRTTGITTAKDFPPERAL